MLRLQVAGCGPGLGGNSIGGVPLGGSLIGTGGGKASGAGSVSSGCLGIGGTGSTGAGELNAAAWDEDDRKCMANPFWAAILMRHLACVCQPSPHVKKITPPFHAVCVCCTALTA